jgi:cytochrome c oxidase subunit 3
MIVKKDHSFHLVDQSPWPLVTSLGALTLTTGIAKWFHTRNILLIQLGLIIIILTSYQWWRDITRERTFQGLHTNNVLVGIKLGIILFIVSEVFFFLSFFWAFFHRRLSPTTELGLIWPPIGVIPFNSFQIPLLNTIILLASGVTVTWSHHAIIENNLSQAKLRLTITILLGLYFTSLQALEYWEANFSIAEAAYGSTFFMATGFHGLHVIIGTTFLFICLIRITNAHFSRVHHFGFEAAAWYWHFVDVVWLFLYINVYWWGSYAFIILVKLTSN